MPTDGIAERIMRATALAALVVGAAETAAAQSTCAKLWFRVAAEGVKAKAACHAKAAAAGTAVDPVCLAVADDKLARKWAKAALKSDCPTEADAAAAQARVDAFIAGIADLLTPAASHCCATNSVCFAGSSIDGASCFELLGSLGPPGSVCDATTGACVAPPGATGLCCALPQLSICTAGSGVTSDACVAAGGSAVPNAVCHEIGACALE